jgi:chromate reductase
MESLRILGISGSLRAASYNTAMVRAVAGLAPDDMRVEVYGRLRDIPPYDGDLDTAEPPEPVADLRQRITEADGLIIATPEYNYGVPGVLKNAIDWASRPAASSVLKHKPVALMGAAPSQFGTVRAQLALRQSFLWTDSRVLTKPEVLAFKANERFDADGNLVDRAMADLLVTMLDAFARLIRDHQPVGV